MGENTYQVTQTMPVATSLGRTDAAARKVERALQDVDGVQSYQVTVGSGQGFGPADLSTNAATVTATPTGTDTGAVSADVQRRLAGVTMPSGATWDLGGVTTEQNDAFRRLLLAVAAAIAIVFIVMVAAFRSVAQPLILLISIPFAATGAIGLLLATHVALGVPGLIGMLMLVGIVVTNAIVLIDLINQYRRQGMSVREAVVEGGRRRLRPILMTAVATIFALLPMAFGLTGGGLFISQPLAIVVIGGLVTSTLLTLVLVPTLYTMVEGRRERRHGAGAGAREEQPDPVMAR